ncbi:MAG: hypothetical protein NZ561_10160, partial [Phycisphaerae bacterium]|nr:hypothetical protein [Phycisphaerae bacterium]MDW8263044.1 hypothetical protein [Phycisphaerales bacterium]
MQLAISTYSLWRWMRENRRSPEDAVRQIADFGVAGVEFAGLDPLQPNSDPLRRARVLARAAARSGLQIVGYCVAAELLVPSEQQRRAIRELFRQVDAAVELGVRTMRHDVTRG